MTTVEIPKVVVLEEITFGYEIIRAEHHTETRESYCYYVRLIYGPYHGLEFRCRTEESTLWLYDHVVACRATGRAWNWLDDYEWRQVK